MELQNSTLRTPNNDEIDLIELLGKYISKWRYFAVAVPICLLVAFVYLKFTPPQFTVSGSILLRSDDKSKLSSQLSMLSDMGLSVGQKQADDEIEVVRSKRIIGQMVETLGLQTQYFLKTNGGYKEQYKKTPASLTILPSLKDNLQGTIEIIIKKSGSDYQMEAEYKKPDNTETFSCTLSSLNANVQTPWGVFAFKANSNLAEGCKFKIVVSPYLSMVETYAQDINVELAKKESNVIKVSLVCANTQKGCDIINTIIALYNIDVLNDKNLTASKTAEFVDDRLRLISGELSSVEQDVESYQKSHNIADIPSQTKLVLESSTDYQKQMTAIEIQRSSVEWVEQQVKKPQTQYDIIPANLGIEDKALTEVIVKYDELLNERSRMLASTNEHNPTLLQLESQIKSMRNNIIVSIANVKQGLAIAKANLDGKNNTLNSKIKNVPTIEREFTEIKRQQEIKQNLYLFLLQKREENALSLAAAVTSTKIVDPAYISPNPVSPKRMMVMGIALLLGIFLTIAYLYVHDLIYNKVNNRKELEQLTSAPILGEVGLFKGKDRIVVKEGSNTPLSEMFRMIRTNLNFLLPLKQDKTILVTSSIAGEGKTFVAMNLALSLALLKKKVVVVGLDIRKPRLADYLHVRSSQGVTSFLTDEGLPLSKLIVPSQIHPMLDVLQSGPVPPNPAELLQSPRLEELFTQLNELYDYIIVDTSPIGLVADTFSLNRIANAVIFIARQDVTPKEYIKHIHEIVQAERLTNLAIVLNGVDFNAGYGYRYKGYGYGGYGDKKNKK